MALVEFLDKIIQPKISDLGGKGYALSVLLNKGFNIPKGFVIISDSFFDYLEQNNLTKKIEKLSSELNENNYQEKSKKIKNLILSERIPEKLISEIRTHLNKLNVEHVSIRSSAISEDSLKASFAGLHDTFLNVKTDLVLEQVKKCWASLFNERAIIYRIKKGIPHLEGMAVIIQKMIPSEVSGITFTMNPTDENSLLIEASYGVGDIIVGGKVEPDNYVISRKTVDILEKKIGKKNIMSVAQIEGVKLVNVEKECMGQQVVSDDKIKEIAKICLEVENNFKYPQDIEWCLHNDIIYLLQTRFITGRIKWT